MKKKKKRTKNIFMKYLWKIGILFFITTNSFAQIDLYEVSWGGSTKNRILLDSVLKVPSELLFSQILQDIDLEKLPKDVFYGSRRKSCKMYLLYDKQLTTKDLPRKTGIENLDSALSNMSDQIFNAIQTHLLLKPKTIYILSICIEIRTKHPIIVVYYEEGGIRKYGEIEEFFIKYEKEKELFGQEKYHVITIYNSDGE